MDGILGPVDDINEMINVLLLYAAVNNKLKIEDVSSVDVLKEYFCS